MKPAFSSPFMTMYPAARCMITAELESYPESFIPSGVKIFSVTNI